MDDWGMRFDYKGFHNCDSFCFVKVNGNAVICTEAPDNHGTSVTNMAEGIARDVCDQFRIPMHNLIWIEHYPEDSVLPERFSFVEFDITKDRLGRTAFAHPRWKHITEEGAMVFFKRG